MTKRATDDGTITDTTPAANDWGLVVRPIGGTAPVPSGTISTSTQDNVTGASQLLLPANTDRLGFSVKNTSTGSLWLRLATGAATLVPNNTTVELVPEAYYESPFNYQGELNAIGEIADGEALVTEYTFVP